MVTMAKASRSGSLNRVANVNACSATAFACAASPVR